MGRRHKLIMYALAMCVVLCACGPSQEAAKPRYPVVPLPPSATNVTIDRSIEGVKETTFETNVAPDAVYQFYRETLPQRGWVLDQQYEKGITFGYLNIGTNPAFALGVIVIQRDETTQVLLRQVISGPFQWDEP